MLSVMKSIFNCMILNNKNYLKDNWNLFQNMLVWKFAYKLLLRISFLTTRNTGYHVLKSGKIYIFSQGAMLFLKLISFSHKLLLIFFFGCLLTFQKLLENFLYKTRRKRTIIFKKNHKVKNTNISFTSSSSSEHIVGTRK